MNDGPAPSRPQIGRASFPKRPRPREFGRNRASKRRSLHLRAKAAPLYLVEVISIPKTPPPLLWAGLVKSRGVAWLGRRRREGRQAPVEYRRKIGFDWQFWLRASGQHGSLEAMPQLPASGSPDAGLGHGQHAAALSRRLCAPKFFLKQRMRYAPQLCTVAY
jgi:hypothetical protein